MKKIFTLLFILCSFTGFSQTLNADLGSGSIGLNTIVGNPVETSYLVNGWGLNNAPGNITITASAGFEVSLTAGTGFTSSVNLPYSAAYLDPSPVFVRVNASVAAVLNGTITHTGGGATVVKSITATILDLEPTLSTNNIVLSNFTDNTMDINWTNGNGNARIIVIRETAVTGSNLPSDGNIYVANTNIELAPEVNTGNLGNYVVYSGSGNGPITVSGLLPGTNYSVTGIEFNGSNGTNNYYLNPNPAVDANTTGSPAVLLQREFNTTGSPLYMASGNNNRIPTMFRGGFTNLLPNTTYRYYTQAAVASDLRTYSTGAGDPILVDYTVSPITYTYSSSPSITTAGGYGKFTTDNMGNFSGYFGFVHNADVRFTPGNTIYPAVAIAVDGATAVEHRYALTDGTKVLQFANTSGANDGTFIKGTSLAPQTSVLYLFDRSDGAVSRPLTGSLVEGPAAVANSGAAVWGNNFIAGYDNTAGSWNSIIPNVNSNGVQLIQAIDPNQVWPYFGACKRNSSAIWAGVSTINPTGGSTTAVQISTAAAPLGPFGSTESCIIIIPIRLSSFEIQKFGSKVKLNWTTEQELNSKEFIIERSANNTSWTALATVPAAGNSNSKINYTATDNNPVKGINFYRIRKVDLDNRFDYSATKSVLFNSTQEILVTPNPARDIINIYVDNNSKTVNIVLIDASGKVVSKLDSNQPHIQINTASFARGIYYIKVMNDSAVSVSKVLLQ